jgi:polar amino acid transport system substrate-binding protein
LEKGLLTVGLVGSMPPLNMTTKDGDIIGMEPDLAAAMAKAMGVELEIATMDFPDLLPALQRGEIDMVLSNMTITGKRNLKVAFVGPYYISGKSLLTKLDTLADIDETSVLNGPETTLVALEGSTSQEFVEKVVPKAKLAKAKNYDEAVAMVLSDEADAMIADFPACVVSVFRYPEENLTALVKPLTYEPIGVALSAGDHLMVNWVENFLETAEATGFLEKIEEKWMGDDSWLDRLP